jgi:hypothetical protein
MPNDDGSSPASIWSRLMLITQVEQHDEQMLLQVDAKRPTPA